MTDDNALEMLKEYRQSLIEELQGYRDNHEDSCREGVEWANKFIQALDVAISSIAERGQLSDGQ